MAWNRHLLRRRWRFRGRSSQGRISLECERSGMKEEEDLEGEEAEAEAEPSWSLRKKTDRTIRIKIEKIWSQGGSR